MARMAMTLRASVAIGLTMTGVVFAQTAPDTAIPENPAPYDPNTTTTNPAQPKPTPIESESTIHTAPPPVTTQTTPQTTYVPSDPLYARSPTYPAPSTTVVVEHEQPRYTPVSRMGIAIAAGGGASGFTNDTLRNTTNVGGDWDVRLTFGTRSPLAFEASYIGSAQQISALGLTSDAVLVGNGAQGALRFNATIDFPVQPFLFAGAAWRHYNINANTNLSDIKDKDDVLEFPMGVGLAGRWSGLILDARGEFRASTNEDLVVDNAGSGFAPMHRWGAKATAGFEF